MNYKKLSIEELILEKSILDNEINSRKKKNDCIEILDGLIKTIEDCDNLEDYAFSINHDTKTYSWCYPEDSCRKTGYSTINIKIRIYKEDI